MDSLAYDLLLFLHEPKTCAVLVRIAQRIPEDSPPGTDNGKLRCRVEDVIHGHLSGQWITVSYSRKIDPLLRAKSSVNHWNAMPLNDDDLLLLVGEPLAGESEWKARSGNMVPSSNDSVVVGLRECYRIQEKPKGSAEHQSALSAGLVAENPLARRYALEAISKHEVVSREVGCEMITRALTKRELDRTDLLNFANCLSSSPLFSEAHGADDVNKRIFANLAAIAERLAKPEDRATCVRYLASCALTDFDSDKERDGKTRSTLLLAINKSPPKPIADTLTLMIRSNDQDERDIAKELTEAWKKAE